MSDEAVGAAIGELLTGFSTSIYAANRQSTEYQTLAELTRAEALEFVWNETRDITVAIAGRIAIIEGLPIRRSVLELLFGIHTEVDKFRTEYRGDMLGGSTDRAFQSYRRLLDAAFQNESSPVVEIPETMAYLASLAHVYDHMEGSTSQLLRWLEIRPKSRSALWTLAGDRWGIDKSSHLRYRLWNEFGRTVFNQAAQPLRPTYDDVEAIGESIFGPESSA